MNIISGLYNENKIRIGIVASRFNEVIVSKLIDGAVDGLSRHGAVIRGETDHYEHVATEVTKGVAMASLSSGVPVLYGVLTTDTIEQAINRAGLKSGNKGFECAMDALEMASLFKKLDK